MLEKESFRFLGRWRCRLLKNKDDFPCSLITTNLPQRTQIMMRRAPLKFWERVKVEDPSYLCDFFFTTRWFPPISCIYIWQVVLAYMSFSHVPMFSRIFAAAKSSSPRLGKSTNKMVWAWRWVLTALTQNLPFPRWWLSKNWLDVFDDGWGRHGLTQFVRQSMNYPIWNEYLMERRNNKGAIHRAFGELMVPLSCFSSDLWNQWEMSLKHTWWFCRSS